MTRFFNSAAVLLAITSCVSAQCGSGSPDATVTGSGSSFKASKGSTSVYSGSDYRAAIQAAVDSIGSGQRIAVMASGSIGANTITIGSGKTFEGCGTIDTANRAGHGAIESLGTTGVKIPYLTMTGNPYFGLRFYGTKDLELGAITMNLSGGLGIRFDRDAAANSNVKMGTITVHGAGSHAVETWNIDGLTIDKVVARDVGECGLLLQKTTNAKVGLVDGDNVATGTGYATFRMANNNGQLSNGAYTPNVFIDKVVSRGGGRGVFCVSQSGGAVISQVDLANNGNNAILLENCYNVAINGGTVSGGGEVRVSSRDEFPVSKDLTIKLTVNNNSVRESPCGTNISWSISGNASKNLC
ncbi:ricin B lectin [Xylaria flabelliformis]|nr:ricin B lectin [Xylaria flabelliformis]